MSKTKAARPFQAVAKTRNVLVVDVNLKSIKDPVEVLLRSDAHHDNPACRQDLEKRHLDQALERDACILDLGDLFCVMEGKSDRRASKNLRPEDLGGGYLNKVLENAVDFYAPYARNWILAGQGNHEYSVAKAAEFDLTQAFTQRMEDRTGYPIHAGGFGNWIIFRIRRPGASRYVPYSIYAHHGYGGGGIVTQGAIQGQRAAAKIEGADLYVSGHVHESWHMERQKYTLDGQCNETVKTVDQICVPTYKDEALTEGRGFHHEKGRPPKPLGAWWLRIWLDREQRSDRESISTFATFERAK